MREFKEQFGFVTIAQNSDVDYLHLAYEQAKNIKATQKLSSYTVIVDEHTAEHLTTGHRKVFDHIVVMPVDLAKDDAWKLKNECQVFDLTHYNETIKLECDLLFTRDISHWLDAVRLREVCFSLHCRNYQGQIVKQTPYRNIFRQNNLPDVYTGMYYMRYSRTATSLFKIVKSIYTNWVSVKDNLVQCDDNPTTDVVFALAVKLLGEEQCIIPTLDFFNFAHMKSGIQKWSDAQPWTDYVNVEQDGSMLRINNLNQYNPVHYYEKSFLS
jgi:hypothetical protein